MRLTSYEKRNYVVNDRNDFVILKKVKLLEKKELNAKDKEAVNLIRTQLKRNWRLPLIKHLNRLEKRYLK